MSCQTSILHLFIATVKLKKKTDSPHVCYWLIDSPFLNRMKLEELTRFCHWFISNFHRWRHRVIAYDLICLQSNRLIVKAASINLIKYLGWLDEDRKGDHYEIAHKTTGR